LECFPQTLWRIHLVAKWHAVSQIERGKPRTSRVCDFRVSAEFETQLQDIGKSLHNLADLRHAYQWVFVQSLAEAESSHWSSFLRHCGVFI
jgi:hypothetical protein